ncbi:Endonuclease/exonuclease/phosphatase [Naematelia encephala]|uniref:DNA-(apurinic or apyrimidinic site) endonuclease n=1 Tax=Naematelia encephala TaxID=71784 RepID=A0A1Y2BFB0_9TREE|nr:Endonuclease/exonuclease/phosphatase [Naematelia encephala]
MRILTWNVNVLRTVLDYHPFSSMKKRNVEGLLDELGAEIACFQEHKTRRAQLDKSMACPGPYDGFWTFNHNKTGYSGVCTYTDSRYCVPLKAEEGITGLLLDDKTSTMRPPWTMEERIGCYPDMDDMELMDEVDGRPFEPKKLDMEGRAVVCDFGLFVLFNLYCPNETNETRRPYKMNFFKVLQERVRLLMAAGREVIVLGDINIMRAPIDSGEGGIQTSAEQHYEHPARRILDNWCAPKGPMIDVVRESWPDRNDMFTVWNTKLDARSANYGSRIDLILCSPGLRPWIKGGDIQAKIFGSDHCPVYIDLHETAEIPGKGLVRLRDMLNPPDRPMTTAAVYPTDPPRVAPEPPRFATKFFEEFSGRQTTLRGFFAAGSKRNLVSPSPTPTPTSVDESQEIQPLPAEPPAPVQTPRADESLSTPFSLARAAFDAIDAGPSRVTRPFPSPEESVKTQAIDLTLNSDLPVHPTLKHRRSSETSKSKPKATKPPQNGQTKLSSFFAQPKPPPKAKRKSTTPPISPSTPVKRPSLSPVTSTISPAPRPFVSAEEDSLIAQAMASAEADREEARAAKNKAAAPVWAEVFAKKLPPLCVVHQKPCKDYIVKIPGPNKGKRFWLCSLPVGAGYDTGRSKRPREDVNPNFRCDFFLWDTANSRKEAPKVKGDSG